MHESDKLRIGEESPKLKEEVFPHSHGQVKDVSKFVGSITLPIALKKRYKRLFEELRVYILRVD